MLLNDELDGDDEADAEHTDEDAVSKLLYATCE